MTDKRHLRALANKYYTRNMRLRQAANKAKDSVKEAMLVRNLHRFFDVLEARHGKVWCSKVYWSSMEVASKYN